MEAHKITEASANLAYEAVLAQIQEGTLQPGDRVPEGQFAAALGISRTPVREALRRLSAEGVVNITHNQGARISVWDNTDMTEVFDLRMLLEGFASALAARKATPEDVEKLRAIEQNFENVINAEEDGFRVQAAQLNNDFHNEILRITGNRRLISMLTNLVAVPVKRGTFRSYRRKDFDYAIRHHRELIRAIARSDELGAELAMKIHINSTRTAVVEAIAAVAPETRRRRRAK